MVKYNVMFKNGCKWDVALEGATKRTASSKAKKLEAVGYTAEIWAVKNENGSQITYKVMQK